MFITDLNNYLQKAIILLLLLFTFEGGCKSSTQSLITASLDANTFYNKFNQLDSSTIFYINNRYIVDLLINAEKYEKMGLYSEAIIELMEALKYDSSKIFMYAIARNFYHLNKLSLALDYAFKSFFKDQDFEANLDLLTTILLKKDMYLEALYFSERLLESEKPNFRFESVERHLSILKKLDTNYAKILAFCDLFPRNPKYSFLLEHKINLYVELNDTTNELLAIDTLLTINEEYRNIENNYVKRYLYLLLTLGHFDQFLNSWNYFASHISSSNAKLVLFYLGSILKETYTKQPQIVDKFVEILKRNLPNNEEALSLIINFYYAVGDSYKASEYEKILLNSFEMHLDILLMIANNIFFSGDKTSAIKILKKYAFKFSNNIDYLIFLSYFYIYLDSLKNAEILLVRALEIDSANDKVYANLGLLYDKWNKPNLSDYYYEKAIKINNLNDVVLNNYAYSLIEREERLDYAQSLIESALEISPQNPSFLDTYGWLFFKLGKYKLALQYILKSIELGIESYEQYLHLAMIYNIVGEKKLAEESIFKAKEIAPENDLIKRKIEEIIKK